MQDNKCVLKHPTVLYFPTLTGESCCLSFGYNTKFEYKFESNGKVKLIRKNMDFTIPRIDFEKLFKII